MATLPSKTAKAPKKIPAAKFTPAKPDNRAADQKKTQPEAPAVAAASSASKPSKDVAAKTPQAKDNAPAKVKPTKEIKPTKEKTKKPKLVRDSFTMPENEYQALGDIKKACVKAGFEIKKSELLRIGVDLLKKMPVPQIQQALSGLPSLKAGRPRKEK